MPCIPAQSRAPTCPQPRAMAPLGPGLGSGPFCPPQSPGESPPTPKGAARGRPRLASPRPHLPGLRAAAEAELPGQRPPRYRQEGGRGREGAGRAAMAAGEPFVGSGGEFRAFGAAFWGRSGRPPLPACRMEAKSKGSGTAGTWCPGHAACWPYQPCRHTGPCAAVPWGSETRSSC